MKQEDFSNSASYWPICLTRQWEYLFIGGGLIHGHCIPHDLVVYSYNHRIWVPWSNYGSQIMLCLQTTRQMYNSGTCGLSLLHDHLCCILCAWPWENCYTHLHSSRVWMKTSAFSLKMDIKIIRLIQQMCRWLVVFLWFMIASGPCYVVWPSVSFDFMMTY